MFICGKEEPISNNEFLLQKNRYNENLILDQSAGVSANRYTFVENGERKEGAVATLTVNLLSQVSNSAIVVICWRVQLPWKSKVASKVIESRYAKKGFWICIRNDHYIAVSRINVRDLIKWPPCEINLKDVGFVILIGCKDEMSAMEFFSINYSLHLARNQKFIPDIDFLTNLGAKSLSLLYQVNDNLK